MNNDELNELSESADKRGLWHNHAVLWVLVIVALGLTATIQNVGAVAAFVIAVGAALVARKQGSFHDLGFRGPASWVRLFGTTLIYSVLLQTFFLTIVEPLLARFTGVEVDVSVFDHVRGDFTNFLILLTVGWIVGGFLEEFSFRGFVVGRVRWMLGSGTAATWFAVLLAAVPFGLAHAYQGVSGMLTTGLTGFILGAVYVRHGFNIWYPIFTHGFINTLGIIAIYLDVDRGLGDVILR